MGVLKQIKNLICNDSNAILLVVLINNCFEGQRERGILLFSKNVDI